MFVFICIYFNSLICFFFIKCDYCLVSVFIVLVVFKCFIIKVEWDEVVSRKKCFYMLVKCGKKLLVYYCLLN